ncbi:complement C1q-like protein 4 [Mytilus edulis]|uniref:complement C1q-like protein 4 n=1 Tax=Mytilus edulis TaxID=6550 RepID=UPI0039EE7AEB
MLVSSIFVMAICCLASGDECSVDDGSCNVNINFQRKQSEVIAFHARMSTIVRSLAVRQTLIFDTKISNHGDGYNKATGIFTVPKSGTYVFVWVIRMHKAEHSIELVINDTVFGSTFLRAKNGDDGSVSNTVVVDVARGDNVFVRNHGSLVGDGIINNNQHGKSTFSGWRLG